MTRRRTIPKKLTDLLPEVELQRSQKHVCDQLGLLYHHIKRSDLAGSEAGFPDTFIIAGDTLFAYENKRPGNTRSPEQVRWGNGLEGVRRVVYGVIYPEDWPAARAEILARAGIRLMEDPHDQTPGPAPAGPTPRPKSRTRLQP